MTAPSPYEVGFNIGSNIGKGLQAYQDRSALDEVLMRANQTQDPNVINDTMQQILTRVSPEKQPMAMQILQNKQKAIQEKAQREREQQAYEKAGLGKYYGVDPALAKESLKRDWLSNTLGSFGMESTQDQMAPSFSNLQDAAGFTGRALQQDQGQPQQPGQIPQGTQPNQQGIRNLSNAQLERMQLIPETQKLAETELKRRNDLEKTQAKMSMEFHKLSAPYRDNLRKGADTARSQLQALQIVDNSIKSGNVNPWSVANVFKGMGPLADKISNAFMSKDQQAIEGVVPYLLEGWKEIFGVRLSDADLKVLQAKLPDIGKTPEANMTVSNIMKKYAKQRILRNEIASNIERQHNNLRPNGFENMVDEQFEKAMQPVQVINPFTGNTISIPAYEVSDAIKAGARLANE